MHRSEALADLPLRELLARIADTTPAPGGGSASALSCSLAASLVEMAAAFTLARSGLADRHDRMQEICARAGELRGEALELADRDLDAYAPVLEALRLPSADAERPARLQAALSRAAEPPLALTRVGAEIAALGAELARTGSPSLTGDAVTATLLAEGACRAAACLVELNLTVFSRPPDREAPPHDARLTTMAGFVRLACQSRLQVLEVNADTPRTEH